MSAKYIDVDEFQSEGYLQEVNRCFLHLLGLALSISKCTHKEQTLADCPRQWQQLYKHAPEDCCNKTFIDGVIDCRDDPEGIFFDPTELDIGDATKKYINVSLKSFDKIYPRAVFAKKNNILLCTEQRVCAQDLKYNV